jgi:asparagine synthase (glutamine-hydrolysing)
LPKTLIDRPKSGFAIPLENWLQNELKLLLDKYLSYNNLVKSNIYNVEYVLKLKTKIERKESINLSILWFILMFEMWKERWL